MTEAGPCTGRDDVMMGTQSEHSMNMTTSDGHLSQGEIKTGRCDQEHVSGWGEGSKLESWD